MSLSDLASLGSFVSGFAVLASLIYLALQVRQAEKNQRGLMQQARATRFCDHLDRIADSETVGAYMRVIRGDPETTVRDLDQSSFLFRASMYAFEDVYFQHSQKQLDDAAFKSTVAAMSGTLANPGARVMWKRLRRGHESSFQTFVDAILRDVRPLPSEAEEQRLADWQEAIAAELSEVRS